jgi:hypothetical protein
MQEQLTAEKAADYSSKLRFKLKEATREIVCLYKKKINKIKFFFLLRNVIYPKLKMILLVLV